jgi:hypothetical protein
MKIGSEVSRFSVEGDGNPKFTARGKLKSILAISKISGNSGGRAANPGHAARGKLQEILAGRERARACGTEGSVKSR